jgi:hypothetical protein
MIRAAFETLYEEGKTRAKILTISMHPYISGVAHRAGYLDKALAYLTQQPGVVFMRGVDILDWYLETHSPTSSARKTGRHRRESEV